MIRLHTGVKMIPPAEAAKAVLNDVINRADLVIIEGRNSVRNLREHLRERSKLSIELERATAELRIGDTPSFVSTIFGTECELDSDAHDEILSVGREALANAFHHADASEIEVELRYSFWRFVLVCRDNGCGVPTETLETGRPFGHYGLVGMRERAHKLLARFEVTPGTPQGTVITLIVPARVAYGPFSRHFWRYIFDRRTS